MYTLALFSLFVLCSRLLYTDQQSSVVEKAAGGCDLLVPSTLPRSSCGTFTSPAVRRWAVRSRWHLSRITADTVQQR